MIITRFGAYGPSTRMNTASPKFKGDLDDRYNGVEEAALFPIWRS